MPIKLGNDEIVAGVCSGLAAHFKIDPFWIRVTFVLGTVFTGGGGIGLYLTLWVCMPENLPE